jgi:hypothetical protein
VIALLLLVFKGGMCDVVADTINKMHRIDVIDWNQTPRSKFKKSDREQTEISYVN